MSIRVWRSTGPPEASNESPQEKQADETSTFTDRTEAADVSAVGHAGHPRAAARLQTCTCDAPSDQAGSTVPAAAVRRARVVQPTSSSWSTTAIRLEGRRVWPGAATREHPPAGRWRRSPGGPGQHRLEGFQQGNGTSSPSPQRGGWLRVFPAGRGTSDGARYLSDLDPEIVLGCRPPSGPWGERSPQETPSRRR
jgi:hypothetical protein